MFRKGVEMGSSVAQCHLAHCYEHGKGVPEDKNEAKKLYECAANQNNSEGEFQLGSCYYRGKGVREDIEYAKRYYEKAASKKHSGAQYMMAVYHMSGRGLNVARNHAKGMKFLKESAEQGYAFALYTLARYSLSQKRRLELHTRAAKSGCMFSANELGHLHSGKYSKSVPDDEAEKLAIMWYSRAAEWGHIGAQIRLATLFDPTPNPHAPKLQFPKLDVPKSNTDAIAWYMRAASQKQVFERPYDGSLFQDHPTPWIDNMRFQDLRAYALYSLGHIFQVGNNKDLSEAKNWYTECVKGYEHTNGAAQKFARCAIVCLGALHP